jgi:hypothetical protein
MRRKRSRGLAANHATTPRIVTGKASVEKLYGAGAVIVVQKFVPTLGCGFAAAGKRALIEPASPDGTGPSAKTLIQSSTPAVPPAACVKLKEVCGGI